MKIQDLELRRDRLASFLENNDYSRSTLRALLVLAAFDADDGERELAEVARELDLSPSTAHRYVRTWIALGLLDQDPASRRYRRADRARRLPKTAGVVADQIRDDAADALAETD